LELYQHLFFLLQTQPKYLARLIRLQTANQVDEQGRRLLQGVVLALYSYGQSRREEYLLLKLLQVSEDGTFGNTESLLWLAFSFLFMSKF
jgi:Ras GTPase-activating-like protein IQGAP2/3